MDHISTLNPLFCLDFNNGTHKEYMFLVDELDKYFLTTINNSSKKYHKWWINHFNFLNMNGALMEKTSRKFSKVKSEAISNSSKNYSAILVEFFSDIK